MSAASKPSLPRASLITIATYIDKEWREETYNTADPNWREVFKILRATSNPVKLIYSYNHE